MHDLGVELLIAFDNQVGTSSGWWARDENPELFVLFESLPCE